MADSRNDDKASTDHEYVVCYKKPDAVLKGIPIDQDKYTNPDNDPRGPWFSDNLTGIANQKERPNLHYDLVNPETGRRYPLHPLEVGCVLQKRWSVLLPNAEFSGLARSMEDPD